MHPTLLPVVFLLLGARPQENALLGASEFVQRRAAVVARLEGGAFALDAGPLGEVGSDANTPLFDFKYLTGFHDPEGVFVCTPKRSAVFVSKARGPVEGIDEVLPLEKLSEWAAAQLPPDSTLFTKLRRKNQEALQAAVPGLQLAGSRLGGVLTRLRLLKSPAEVALIRKASDATNRAHVAALKALKPGVNEREIQDLVLAAFRKEGCPEIGFPPIVAAGANGTVLHYMKNNQVVPPGTLMVLDIGAAVENYVTDITRTLPTSGRYSAEQRKAYQTVLDAQKAAEAVLRPGAAFSDLERAARRVFEERGMTEWSYAHSKEPSVRHGLGHYVGMSVHDSGTYRERFEPGMVITIEPGWYDKASGYGIRIEDMYLVTADGFERLSAGAPREIEEIEAAMAGKREY
jgi:Xaa-Pro aminopeptidase